LKNFDLNLSSLDFYRLRD